MRDDFTIDVKHILATRVGLRCSNPRCRQLTTGPREDETKNVNIGVACHITAASELGPRFDETMTSEQRKAPSNGIWLCQNCAKLIDNDSDRFTVDSLRTWKQLAEDACREQIETPNQQKGNPINVLVASAEIDGQCDFYDRFAAADAKVIRDALLPSDSVIHLPSVTSATLSKALMNDVEIVHFCIRRL